MITARILKRTVMAFHKFWRSFYNIELKKKKKHKFYSKEDNFPLSSNFPTQLHLLQII